MLDRGKQFKKNFLIKDTIKQKQIVIKTFVELCQVSYFEEFQ